MSVLFAVLGITLAVIAVTNTVAQQSKSTTAPTGNVAGNAPGIIPQMMFIEAKDDGGKITIKRGAFLLVRLEANPSTGYSWSVTGDPAPLSLISSDFDSAQQGQQKAGAPGMQLLRFKANLTGSVELKLGYRRPWEKDVAPAKVFQIRVTVPEGPVPLS